MVSIQFLLDATPDEEVAWPSLDGVFSAIEVGGGNSGQQSAAGVGAKSTFMLRLNPNDNQGIRYILINCLLEEGPDKAIGKLLNKYKGDASATWLYSRALWIFRQEGASERASARLREALELNPFVPSYLLGKGRLPRHLPEYIGIGDESEAIEYAAAATKVWQQTEGALKWLRKNPPRKLN